MYSYPASRRKQNKLIQLVESCYPITLTRLLTLTFCPNHTLTLFTHSYHREQLDNEKAHTKAMKELYGSRSKRMAAGFDIQDVHIFVVGYLYPLLLAVSLMDTRMNFS